MSDWNQVYVPYCDGSLFSSDAQVDVDADGIVDRYHHGLHNLSAALDVAKAEFPAPKRSYWQAQVVEGMAHWQLHDARSMDLVKQ